MKAQRAGVDVLAAAPGRVARTRDGVANASVHTVGRDAVKGKECGNGVIIDHADGWQTQYCHLDQQTVNVKPGDEVKAGQPIGRVGLSGFAEFPHLHFTVRQHSVIVDPFAYGADQNSCASGLSLWAHPAEDGLTYTPAEVLNIGIATGPVTMEAIETGTIGDGPPSLNSAALVAFARAIGLRAGDVPRVTLTDANGQLLADAAANPLDHDKAQYMMFAGKPRPAAGWPSGSYRVIFSVRRNHSRLIERSLDLVL